MLDQGWIDQADHDEALADDVYSRIQNVNTRIEETNTVNSYFVDALSEQLIEDLTSEDGLGYSQTQAENALYSGGLTIYSTQNLTMQNICDEELNDDNNYPANIDWGVDYALTVYNSGQISTVMMKDFSSDHRKLRRKELTHSVTVFSRMARPMMSTSTSLHSRRLHLPSSIRKQGRSKLLSVAVDKRQPTVD